MRELVVSLETLKDKKKMNVTINYQDILLVYSKGEVFAIMDKCPHRGVPLHTGKIEDNTIKCKDHGLAISLESGAVLSERQINFLRLDKYSRSVRTYKVEIDEGNVYVHM